MTTCMMCYKQIPQQEMRKSVLGDIFGMMGESAKTMPNLMEEIAMKCNRCGVWICNNCAVRTATEQSAGMIQHADCGGMFETP